jgi:protein SCO1/2
LHAPSIDRRNSGVYRDDEFDLSVGGNYSGRTFHRGRAAFSSHWEHRQRATPFFVVNNLSAAFVCRINVNQIMTATVVSSNPSTPRKSRAATLALILFPVVIGASMLWLRHVEVQRLASRQIQGYGLIPPFQLINQDGQAFGSSNLAGKIWIADFIYSTCPGPCPMISSRMSEMQKPLEKTDVHFVSFTVDPEKDTPAQLREYAGRLKAQPGRWDFLTGPKSEIYRLSQEGFKLAAVDRSSSNPEPLHSTRMILVDRRGQIRGYYDATTADAVTKLLADTNHLLKEQPR